MKNFIERGFSSTEREIAHDVKEKLVHIVVTTIREKTCELSDGNIRLFLIRESVVPDNLTFTSARICMPTSCSQVARPFSKEFVST